MFNLDKIYSEDYLEHKIRKDNIDSLVLQAKELLKGAKLYGKEISLSDHKELIACLYIAYRDYELFHERF